MSTETRVTVDRTTYAHFLRCACADLGGICSIIASDTRRFTALACSGTAGTVRSIILLIVQISSAGATLPIELATPFFQTLHPYLPFTWVVRAFRASMFGAYDGQWLSHWAVVAGCGAAALAGATLLGRWKVIEASAYHPGIEID